jgi:hypothetical protein
MKQFQVKRCNRTGESDGKEKDEQGGHVLVVSQLKRVLKETSTSFYLIF